MKKETEEWAKLFCLVAGWVVSLIVLVLSMSVLGYLLEGDVYLAFFSIGVIVVFFIALAERMGK